MNGPFGLQQTFQEVVEHKYHNFDCKVVAKQEGSEPILSQRSHPIDHIGQLLY